jgi:signal transduction histidine kinase
MARRHIRAALSTWHVPKGDPAGEVWEDLELVVGELVGNATQFCRGRIEMRVEVHRDHARVEVLDDGAGTESLHLVSPSVPRADAESGRGLVIVSGLASSWGAERRTTSVAAGSGTKVWAELPFRSVSPHFTPGCEVVAV